MTKPPEHNRSADLVHAVPEPADHLPDLGRRDPVVLELDLGALLLMADRGEQHSGDAPQPRLDRRLALVIQPSHSELLCRHLRDLPGPGVGRVRIAGNAPLCAQAGPGGKHLAPTHVRRHGRRLRTNVAEFIRQADEYRATGELADQVFKVLNLLGADHPFPVLRVRSLRDWFASGEYDRIMKGEYERRDRDRRPYREDVAAARRAYADAAKQTFGAADDAARRFLGSFRPGETER
jgi:hypothetical protein